MKYLILGCNGMAGHTISLYLREYGHDVTGFARSKSDLVNTIVGDACDEQLIHSIVEQGDYDVIVNCIGVLNQYAEQNKMIAVYLNSYLPHLLENITNNLSTKIVHISTDCVFSGKQGHYRENDFRDGETFYDRSKGLGEIENFKDVTIRTSIIGPDRNPNGIGLFNWFMQQTGRVGGYSKVIWTGLTTLQLAKIIENKTIFNLSGLINIVPNSNISKNNLLELIKKHMVKTDVFIEKDSRFVIDKSLIPSIQCEKLHIPEYDEMISELSEWIMKWKFLYPHYYL